MGDPYYRYPPAAAAAAAAAAADRGNTSMPSFPGYLSSEAPPMASHYSSGAQQRDPGIYGAYNTSTSGVYPDPHLGGVPAGAATRAYPSPLGDPSLVPQRWDAPVGVSSSAGVHPETSFGGISAAATIRGYSSSLEDPNLVGHRQDASGVSPSGVHPESSLGAVSAGASMKGYPSPIKDPNLVGQRQDGPLGMRPSIPDAIDEKPGSMRNSDGPSVPAEESNILFVDGLPTDCMRREVSHLFRPFAGYKEIKVIHKEPRHSGDRSVVLCFVEFDDSKCAMTAMRALQGYIFDDRKPDSPALRIRYAHFPFRLQADHDDRKAR